MNVLCRCLHRRPRSISSCACVLLTLAAMAAAPATRPVQKSPLKSPATRPATESRAGGLKYRLEGDPDSWDPAARTKIEKAVKEAVEIYNANGTFDFTVPVAYSPQTPTADANYQGHIRFGGQIGTRTCLHELGHIMGVGTQGQWSKFIKNGNWTGPIATAQLKEFDGPDAVLHGDRQHFWPYGLNYDKEGTSPEQFRRHVLLVVAMRADMGLGKPTPTTRPK